MATTIMSDNNPAAGLLRAYREMNSNQYVREIYQNSVEAGAGQVRLTLDFQALDELGVERGVMIDNGPGIDHRIIAEKLNKMNSSGRDTGGVHQNFGIGLKISALPRNQYGLVVICRTEERPKGFMIWLHFDEGAVGLRHLVSHENVQDLLEGSISELTYNTVVDFEEVEKYYSSYTVDGVDYMSWWNRQAKSQKTKYMTGTAIIFLGNDIKEDTANSLLFEGRDFLKSRYLEYSAGVFTSLKDKSRIKGWVSVAINNSIDSLRENSKELNSVTFKGWTVRTFIKNESASQTAKKGERTPLIVSKFVEAIVYKDELYGEFVKVHPSRLKVKRDSWGIWYKKAGDLVTLLVSPPEYNLKTDQGVYPDQSRTNLLWKEGEGSSPTVNLPLNEVKEYYRENMPKELKEMLMDLSNDELVNFKKSKSADMMKKWMYIPRDQKNLSKGHRALMAHPNGDLFGGDSHQTAGGSNDSILGGVLAPPSRRKKGPKRPKTAEELEREANQRKAKEKRRQLMNEPPSVQFVNQSHEESEDRFLITLENGSKSWEAAYYQPFIGENQGNTLYLNSDHPLFITYVNTVMDWVKTKGVNMSRKSAQINIVEYFFAEQAPCSIQHLKSYVDKQDLSIMLSPPRLTQTLTGFHVQLLNSMTTLYKGHIRRTSANESEAS